MSDLITPDKLPVWVPGELTVDSAPLGWQGVRIRGYRYAPLDVPIPGMRDYMIVAYKDGATQMNRRCTGDWRNERVSQGLRVCPSHPRGAVALALGRGHRGDPCLSVAQSMAQVAADAYDRDNKRIELVAS